MKSSPALHEPALEGAPLAQTCLVDFHAFGLAGSIDLLTDQLRSNGIAIEWQTPHHGMEIDSRTATLLYVSARETLDSLLVQASATKVVIRLAAVYHGVRLTIEDNGTTVTGSEPEFAPETRMAVEIAGGNIRRDSSPSGSTRACITLPLD